MLDAKIPNYFTMYEYMRHLVLIISRAHHFRSLLMIIRFPLMPFIKNSIAKVAA